MGRKYYIRTLPHGTEAVLANDSQWDPDTYLGTWRQKHFQACILEGELELNL